VQGEGDLVEKPQKEATIRLQEYAGGPRGAMRRIISGVPGLSFGAVRGTEFAREELQKNRSRTIRRCMQDSGRARSPKPNIPGMITVVHVN